MRASVGILFEHRGWLVEQLYHVEHEVPLGADQKLSLLEDLVDVEEAMFQLDSSIARRIGSEIRAHVENLKVFREQERDRLQAIINLRGGAVAG